jgi:hypothetical protein
VFADRVGCRRSASSDTPRPGIESPGKGKLPQFCFRVRWLREPDAPRLGLNLDRRKQVAIVKLKNARPFIAELPFIPSAGRLSCGSAPAGTLGLCPFVAAEPSGFKCSRLRGTASQRVTCHSRVRQKRMHSTILDANKNQGKGYRPRHHCNYVIHCSDSDAGVREGLRSIKLALMNDGGRHRLARWRQVFVMWCQRAGSHCFVSQERSAALLSAPAAAFVGGSNGGGTNIQTRRTTTVAESPARCLLQISQ